MSTLVISPPRRLGSELADIKETRAPFTALPLHPSSLTTAIGAAPGGPSGSAPISPRSSSQTSSVVGINLVTLGELGCTHNGVETDLPKQKLRFALLVYLGMERSVPREKVAALFWPDVDEKRVRGRLNQSIFALRETFGRDCIETRGDDLRATAALTVDAAEFGDLADEGEYERALALYRRPFLDGFYVDGADEWERWVERKRDVLRRTHAHVARSFIKTQLENGASDSAIDQATRWLNFDEYNDEAHRLLMLALTQAGRRDDALAHFAGLERRRRDDGAPVSEALKTVAQEIRTTRPVAPVTPAPVTVVAPAPPSEPSPPEPVQPKRWVRLLPYGIAATAIAIIATIWLANPLAEIRYRFAELDSLGFVTFPFSYAEGARQPLYEQQVIAEALSGWDGIVAANQVQVRDAVARAGSPLGVSQAREIARSLKLGRFFMGQVAPVRSGQQITIYLYDTRTGRRSDAVRSIPAATASDSIITSAIDDLLFGSARKRPWASFRGTRSIPARFALQRGFEAVESWDLVAADSFFFRAMQHDDNFAAAALWLAQVRSWRPRNPAEWRFAAERALAGRERLSPRELIYAEALAALAKLDYPTACGLYRTLTEVDDNDFVGWYSLANCLYNDKAVVMDASGKLGFRTGLHSAADAYVHAFELLRSAHKGWSSDLFERIKKALITSENYLRLGRGVNSPYVEYVAFPSLIDDTLAFVPIPRNQMGVDLAGTVPSTIRQAVERQRNQFVNVARTWTSAFPQSSEAHLAMAVALDLRGDATAADTLRRARALATDPGLREYLSALEVLFRLKSAFPDGVAELRAVTQLADSLQKAVPPGLEYNSEIMAAVAMLTGRANRAAEYYQRLSSKSGTQASLENLAQRLLVYSSAGVSADSILTLARALKRELASLVADSAVRVALRDEWLVRAATLAYPSIRRDIVEEATTDYLFTAQAAALNGDTTKVLSALAELVDVRSGLPITAVTFDGIYPEAALFVEIGDQKRAIDWLELSLGSLRSISPDQFDDPIKIGALTRAAALRAELARAHGDALTARRFGTALLTLWANADPEFDPLLQQLRRAVR